jgi:hypothetical protein
LPESWTSFSSVKHSGAVTAIAAAATATSSAALLTRIAVVTQTYVVVTPIAVAWNPSPCVARRTVAFG